MDDIAAIRARHQRVDGPVAGLDVCGDENQPWPCDTARLLSALDAAEAREATLREALEQARRPHQTCEDCWYSCPKSGECCNEDAPDRCDCGADRINAIIDAALGQSHE